MITGLTIALIITTICSVIFIAISASLSITLHEYQNRKIQFNCDLFGGTSTKEFCDKHFYIENNAFVVNDVIIVDKKHANWLQMAAILVQNNIECQNHEDIAKIVMRIMKQKAFL